MTVQKEKNSSNSLSKLNIQVACCTVLWIGLHYLLHKISSQARHSRVNVWRSMLRSAASICLCHSVLLETTSLYINHNIFPFAINIFLAIQSALHMLYLTIVENMKQKENWTQSVIPSIWNTASFTTVLYSIIIWTSTYSPYSQTENYNHNSIYHKTSHGVGFAWFLFFLCLDLFACPVVVAESNKKNTNANVGLTWRIIYALVFIVLIHVMGFKKQTVLWDHSYDLRIDSTRHHTGGSSAHSSLTQGWLWLVFVIPVIVCQCQSRIFVCAFQSISSYYNKKEKSNGKDSKNNKHLLLVFTASCIIVFGMNATFYDELRFALLIIHFVLHWISHIASMVLLAVVHVKKKPALPPSH